MIFVLAGTVWAGEVVEQVFQGKIDGEMPIQMRLVLQEGEVVGKIRYDGKEPEFLLEGRVNGNGDLYLEDRDKAGKVYAVFDGVFVTDSRIEGFCSRPEHEGKVLFEAESSKQAKTPRQPWKGIWRRNDASPFDWADLLISKVTASSCYFQLEAGSGAVTRKASGTALFYDNEAIWEDMLTGERIRLVWSGDAMRVEANDAMGKGAKFSGNYRPGFHPLPELSMLKIGVFSNPQQDKAFRDLTGKDYLLFAESFQIVKHSVDDDDFGAVVRSGFVRGMAGIQEAIVIFTPDNRFWAAVVDVEGNVIKYYSNDDKYKKSMPQTIEKWAEYINDQSSMQIIFCSK